MDPIMTRRGLLRHGLAALEALILRPARASAAAVVELTLPDGVATRAFDFEAQGFEEWAILDGRWSVEVMA